MNIAALYNTTVMGTPLATVALYPYTLPDPGLVPAVTYQVVSSVNMPNNNSSGMQRERVQFDLWSKTYSEANSNRDQLIRAMHLFGGPLNDGSRVDRVMFVAKHDDFVYESRYFRLLVEFYVFYAL